MAELADARDLGSRDLWFAGSTPAPSTSSFTTLYPIDPPHNTGHDMSETLVLSPSYEFMTRISWQRAITLYFQGKIEILESYEDKWLRSITVSIQMPSVVRFLKALRGRHKVVRFSRENMFLRDGGRCQYGSAPKCPGKLKREDATYDHVIPRAQGGRTTWENVVISCLPCNQMKGNRTPAQAKMHLRVQPTRPKKPPDSHITLTWRRGMPENWRGWLRDHIYWNGELDNENESV